MAVCGEVYTFEGPILNIYTTLAVRLAHSQVYSRQDMWKNTVTYTSREGGTCRLTLREVSELD